MDEKNIQNKKLTNEQLTERVAEMLLKACGVKASEDNVNWLSARMCGDLMRIEQTQKAKTKHDID